MLGMLQSLFDGASSNDTQSNDILFSPSSPKQGKGPSVEEVMRVKTLQSSPSLILGSRESSSPEKLIARVNSEDFASNRKPSAYNSEDSLRKEVPQYYSSLTELFRSPPSSYGREGVSSYDRGKQTSFTPSNPITSRANDKSATDLFFRNARSRTTSSRFDGKGSSPTYYSKGTKTSSDLLNLDKQLDSTPAERTLSAKRRTPRVACNECYKWKDLWKEVLTKLEGKNKELNSKSYDAVESLKVKLTAMETNSRMTQKENKRLKEAFSKNEKRLEFFEKQIKTELHGEVQDSESKARSLEMQLKIVREELADSRNTIKATNHREQDLQRILAESQQDWNYQQAEFAKRTSELEAEIASLEKKLETKMREKSSHHMKLAELTCLWHSLENDNSVQRSRLQLLENGHKTLEQEHALEIQRLKTHSPAIGGQDQDDGDVVGLMYKRQIDWSKLMAKAKMKMCSNCRHLLNEIGLIPSQDDSACAAESVEF